jgi:hypothetical protein
MNQVTELTIDPETKASTSSALTVLKTSIPALIAADKDDLLSKLKAEIDGFEPDTSTKKGRELIASMAMKPRRVKAAYGRIADSLKEGAQATIKTVNAENKQMAELLDQLAVDLRRPLDEIEAFEAAREKANKDNIAAIEAIADGLSTLTADEIKVRYRSLSALVEFSWSIEFTARAQRVRDGVVAQLEIAHQAAKQREEAAAAEVARLAEEAERQRPAAIEAQRLREEQIARDAAEAARVAAEAKAARDAEEAAARAKEAQEAAERQARAERDTAAQRERDAAEALAQAERDKQEAQERAQQLAAEAETARVKGHRDALEALNEATNVIPGTPPAIIRATLQAFLNRPERDWQELAQEAADLMVSGEKHIQACLASAEKREADKAEADRIASDRQAEIDRKAAADAAIKTEQKRQADAQAEEDRKTAARARNVAHRKQINGEVLADLMVALRMVAPLVAGGSEAPMELIAKAVIVAVAKNEIRHCSISY